MNKTNGFWRSAMAFGAAGLILVVATGVGGFLGHWLDRELSTTPWLLVSGLLLGAAAGFVELYRIVKKFTQ